MASHFLLLYEYPDDVLERRAPHREEHLALVRKWKEDGRILLAGAIGDPPNGAALTFRVDDAADVDDFIKSDSYVREGVVTSHRVEPWNLV
ncbi:MAG: uncharacterized protein QOI64_2294 [Solirubrobacteraceae bacterium]|jgi:uncharacterized protein YciI|nr:uncharacterized protein [Solirubrobacteraceae bacterium]